MAKGKLTKRQTESALRLLQLLATDPDGRETSEELDRMVTRFDKTAIDVGAVGGLLGHPNWPLWHRLLQVRFVRLACDDRPAIAVRIRELLGGERPPIRLLMREVMKRLLLELFAWGKANRSAPLGTAPKGPPSYWNEAFEAFNADQKRIRDGSWGTIRDVPKGEYAIFGVDYGL